MLGNACVFLEMLGKSLSKLTQTGTITLSMPVPIPLTKRAASFQSTGEEEQQKMLTADHPVRIHGRGLQGCTNNTPDGTKGHDFNTTDFLTDPASYHAADESAEIVDGYLRLINPGLVHVG